MQRFDLIPVLYKGWDGAISRQMRRYGRMRSLPATYRQWYTHPSLYRDRNSSAGGIVMCSCAKIKFSLQHYNLYFSNTFGILIISPGDLNKTALTKLS